MPDYHTFIAARTTEPDLATLLANLRALDASAGIQHDPGTQTYVVKKSAPWTAPQINAAQSVLNTAPAMTPQTLAHAQVDNAPMALWALALMLLDEVNVLRTELNTIRAAMSPPLTPPLALRNEQQAKNAWHAKVGTP